MKMRKALLRAEEPYARMANTTNMSYRWPDGNTVTRIDVRSERNGRSVAYIFADNREELLPQRKDIRAAIRLKGWGTLSDHRHGTFGLRVSGLSDARELIDTLTNQGFVTGTPIITTTHVKAEPAKNAWAYIRNHSLQISGSIATVGNALSLASGFHRGKGIGQIGQGAAFALADLPLAIAGERDDGRQFSNLLRGLKSHYEKTGIEIPKNASIHAETSNRGKGFGELAQDYMHRYANQIKCSLEVVAAAFTIKAGHEQNSAAKKYVPWIWGSGFLASLLIPEKKIDEEKYAQAGGLERAWMKVQSNPLMVGGLLGYFNTGATYASAHNERKTQDALKNQGLPSTKYYRWDYLIPTVMIGANGTYAISKKTVGGDIKNDGMVSDVYSVAAQILNKQPEGTVREAAIDSTAKFLGGRTEIKDTHQQIIVRLKEEMKIQRQNPWFETRGLAPYKPVPNKPRVRVPGLDALDAVPENVVHAGSVQHERPAVSAPEAAVAH